MHLISGMISSKFEPQKIPENTLPNITKWSKISKDALENEIKDLKADKMGFQMSDKNLLAVQEMLKRMQDISDKKLIEYKINFDLSTKISHEYNLVQAELPRLQSTYNQSFASDIDQDLDFNSDMKIMRARHATENDETQLR